MEEYKKGDRVVLHGLKKAAHLNDRHGHIGTTEPTKGRYPVNLDLLDATATNFIVMAKETNLKREGEPYDDLEEAKVENSCLAEEYGRPFSLLLDTVRFLSATVLVGDTSVTSLMDIHRLISSGSQQNLMRCNHFLSAAYTRWNEDRGDGLTFHERVLKLMEEDMVATGGHEAIQQKAIEALKSSQAAKSWGVRVHGSFYVVGIDEHGTYLIPVTNHDTVYCVVGIVKKIYTMVPNAASFPAIKATFLPYYSRLVSDAVIVMDPQVRPAKASLREKLTATMENAKEEGRVVRCLRQLQVHDGSLEGTDPKVEATTSSADQASPTETEKKLLQEFFDIRRAASDPMAPGGMWTFRRFGYNEQENPNHLCTILSGMNAMGMFMMRNGLELDSIDVLTESVKHAKMHGRPCMMLIDQRKCLDRIKFLFEEAYTEGENTVVDFYRPPSQEESAAAMARGMI